MSRFGPLRHPGATVVLVAAGVALNAAPAAAVAPARAAEAAPPAETAPAPEPTAGYTLKTYDPAGNLVAVQSGTGETVSPPRSIASMSGCNILDAWRSSYTLLGTLAYRFHQVKHWCWSFPSITSVSVGTYISSIAFTYVYRGVVSAHAWFYPLWGSSRGGHYSFRQGRVDNCLLYYGCIRTEFPSVSIWVNADGWWLYTTSMN